MEPIYVAVIVILILFGGSLAGTLTIRKMATRGRYDSGMRPTPLVVVGGLTTALLFLTLLVVGWLAIGPEYRLWRATIEKRIAVEEARATADSAIELARAEVERAKGTAEANTIVAESITEPYLRYLYINQIAETDNQIIYLPTEAGLPILEADRFRSNGGDE